MTTFFCEFKLSLSQHDPMQLSPMFYEVKTLDFHSLFGHVASVLRVFIGLRTASLERQSKTELLNIREQLRLEKKRVQKEINDVDEKVTRIEQDQTHFVQDIKREKLKESSKYSVELQRNQSAIRESENKVSQEG